MISRVRIQNYKALRDVAVELTPLHVLIGPNDSGKTSILEAVAALSRTVDHTLDQSFTGLWDGRKLVWQGNPDLNLMISAAIEQNGNRFEYSLMVRFPPTERRVVALEERFVSEGQAAALVMELIGHPYTRVYNITTQGESADDQVIGGARLVRDSLAGAHYYQWVPRMLSLPVAPDSKRRFRMESSGFGLALCLDDILGFDRSRFDDLENRFRAVFPQVKSIKLLPEPAFRSPTDDPELIPRVDRADGKGIYFEMSGSDQLVAAAQVSDGMLLVLAYIAVLNLPQPPRVVLVEEPENGIHPRRLQDVIRILRDLIQEQCHTQVILTTHSPYVLDLFKPEEVTICRRQDDGSIQVNRLSASQTVREQLDVFTLGEIWTAEGDDALAGVVGSAKESTP